MAEHHHTHGTYQITIRTSINNHGAATIDTLEIARTPDGKPITRSAIRFMPFAEWLQAAETHTHTDGWNSPYEQWALTPGQASTTRMTHQTLTNVAHVYRQAIHHGDDPTNTVAAVFRKPRSTAGRWVMEARRRGLLEPIRKATP